MKLDVLGVQAFVALAAEGRFNRAAAALHITQTALTRRLQNLEAGLGVVLVERTTRSLSLTPVGQDFLPQARRLLDELGATLREIRERGQALTGDVTIACVPTVGVQFLPSVIRSYAQAHPGNRIRVLDHSAEGVQQAVMRREVEFGITLTRSQPAEIVSRPLLQDRFVLVVPRGGPFGRRRFVRWRELAERSLILPGIGSSNRPLLDAGLGAAGIDVRSSYEVQRSSTAVGLVQAGVGLAVVPSLSLQEGSYPSLRAVALREPELIRTFSLVTRTGAVLSPAARALLGIVVAKAKSWTVSPQHI